jgi:hypothetical protein
MSETDERPVYEDRASLNDCPHKSWELGLSGMPLRCSDCGHVFDTAEAQERDTEPREIYASPAPPTGGGLYAVDYYFTVNANTPDEPVYQTCVRRVVLPRDSVATCKGNTLVIEHIGVADTFRIGRVTPVDAA